MPWVWLLFGFGILAMVHYKGEEMMGGNPEQFPIRKKQLQFYGNTLTALSIAQIAGRFTLHLFFYELVTAGLMFWFWRTEPAGERKKMALWVAIGILVLSVLSL